MHLLNVPHHPLKNSLPLHGRLWVQIHSQVTEVCHILNSRKIYSIDLNSKYVKFPNFCPFFTASIYEGLENQNLKMEIKIASQSMIYRSEKDTSPNFRKSILKLLRLLAKNLLHTQ